MARCGNALPDRTFSITETCYGTDMKTTLEFVVALTTGILFSGALIGAGILGVGALCGGSCYWLWRRFGRRK